MTCLDRFLRRAAWTFLILIAGAHVLIPTHVLAQVDTCTMNTVDGTNDVEETVCLFSDSIDELDGWTFADSWAYSDSQNWPNGDPYVVGLGTEVQISDDINGSDFDSGLVENGAASGSVGPTPGGANYTASGTTYECYDPTGTWSSDCNWQGAGGVSVSAYVPGPPPLPPLSTPTLSLTTSGTPTTYGYPVTFTATISFDASGEDVDFYGSGDYGGYGWYGYIGSGTFSGTTATYTTSTLPQGTDSITAYYNGDSNYSAVTSSGTTQIVLNSAPAVTIYSYTITPDGGASGYAANGNVVSYNDSVMGSWSFGYDALNRLSSATAAPAVQGNSSFAWTYDSFGNRLTQTGNGGMNIFTQSENDSSGIPHNQITSTNARGVLLTSTPSPYDAAGNMQTDGVNQYLYDSDGHVCAVKDLYTGSMTGYVYNASGQRVAKGTITSLSCDITASGFILTRQYILGPNGEQMTEIAVSGGASTWMHTNVVAGGVIATYLNDNVSPHFRLTDWLGTTRAQTNNTGAAELTCQSLPFGDTSAQCAPATEQFFTGYERDAESGNDYAQTRHYANSMGRFLSPDDGSDQNPSNPQSWNLYSYVRNNPVIHTDPDGHSVNVCDTYGNCNVVSNQEYTAAQGSDPYNSAPTLDEVGMSGNGAGQFSPLAIFSDSGIVGSATYVSDGPTDYYANWAGLDKTVPASNVVTTMFGYWSAIFAPMMPELLLGTAPEVGLGVGGVGLSMRSTGPGPSNLREHMAIQQVKGNPGAGDVIPLKGGMQDPNWKGSDGWVKMGQTVNTGSGKPIEVHYVMNTRTGEVADFKISK